jgi:hypothetical protein
MFLSFFNPLISIMVIILIFYCAVPVICFSLHESLQGQLRVMTEGHTATKSPGNATKMTEQTDSDTSRPLQKTHTISCKDQESTLNASTNEADAVIIEKPSIDKAVVGSHAAPEEASSTSPDRMRELSQIFVQHTLLTFVLQPFLIFLGCLLVNNAIFCEPRSRYTYPGGLWHMLWVLLPGYTLWACSVVFAWGDTAAAVLGWDTDKKKNNLQVGLMLVVLPVPLLFGLFCALVYSGLVEMVFQGMKRRGRKVAGDQKSADGERRNDALGKAKSL